MLSGKARLTTVTTFHSRIWSIDVLDVPIRRHVIDELSDVVNLLGNPEYILIDPIPSDSQVGYGLRLIYPGRGVQIALFGIAEEISVDGRLTTAVCLGGSGAYRVWLSFSSELEPSEMDSWMNVAISHGATESQIIEWLIDPSQCVSF